MSLREVAQKAGVSHMTVSRVINKDPLVAQETFDRVQAVMREMKYTPPPLRDRFKRRTRRHLGIRTETIALLFPDPRAEAMGTALAAQLALGIDGQLHSHGLDLIVTHLRGPNSLPNCIKRREVDGVIIRGGQIDPSLLASLNRFARVWLFVRPEVDPNSDLVGLDDRMAGVMSAKHLLAKGHRQLACLSPQKSHPAFKERAAAFKETAQAAGATVLEITTPQKGGAEITEKFLSLADRPKGVFLAGATVYANERSIGSSLLGAGHTVESGRHAVFCTSSLEFIQDYQQHFTILDNQARKLGEVAAEVLFQRMQYPDAAPQTVLQPPLLTGQ